MKYDMIDSIDFEVDFQLYRVTLYRGGKAEVFAIKRRNGKPFLSTIKPGGQKFKHVLRECRKIAVRGSLLAENFAEHDSP